MSDESIVRKHPAFVVTQFSRVSGEGLKFFGSASQPSTFIRMRVSRGYINHDLSQDWVHSEHQPLVEIDFTPAQFAELLTSMNVGTGVPSTMRSFDGKRVEAIPEDEKNETQRIMESFTQEQHRKAKAFVKRARDIEELINKKTLSKVDKASVLGLLQSIVQEYQSNVPFALRQFEDAATRVVTQKKAEVDAFIAHSVTTLGLEALVEKTKKQVEDKG